MHSYLQASKNYAIDLETYQLVPLKDVAYPYGELHIPCYFRYPSKYRYMNGIAGWEDTIKLNGFWLNFWNYDSSYDVNGFCSYEVDIKLDGFQMRMRYNTGVSHVGGSSMLDNPLYHLNYGDTKKIVMSVFDSNKFQNVSGLYRMKYFIPTRGNGFLGKGVSTNLYCGLSHRQYEIVVNGKPLRGTCYALLLGTWAILLDDDLSFDSIAILRGVSTKSLEIEKFMYTVNPYIVKVMTLMR